MGSRFLGQRGYPDSRFGPELQDGHGVWLRNCDGLAGSSGIMDQQKNCILLGQLLVRAGLLDPGLVDPALENARAQQTRFGQVLLYSGLIAEESLKYALQAQRMVRQSVLTLGHAVECLKVAVAYGIDMNTAVARLRWLSGHRQIQQLARLVLDAEIVTLEQLSFLLGIAGKTGAPLGRLMMLHGFMNVELRNKVLDILILIRSGDLSYQTGASIIRKVRKSDCSLADLLNLISLPVATLSYEFMGCGILTAVEIADIIEESLQREALWQGSHVMDNLSAHLRFGASVKVAQLCEEGEISPKQARVLCDELLLSSSFKMDLSARKDLYKRIA